GVFNPSSYIRFYLNGELAGELTASVPAFINDPSNHPVRIGRRSDNPGGTSYLDAIVDEVRISHVARSDAWIRTQYNNQKNPELFLTVGEEGVNFQYKKDITIDHNKVAADLTGFPVLIDIYDSDLHTKVQPDGDDIMFTSNGRSLPHEIELFDQQYNSTHAHLVAWVRTDISSVSDTVISMYYANPAMGSKESPEEVWRNQYQGVWHLGDNPSGTLPAPQISDSTYNSNDGTTYGSMTQGDQVSGLIGNALEFDGSNDYVDCGDTASLAVGYNDFVMSLWFATSDLDVPFAVKGAIGTDAYRYMLSVTSSGTVKAEIDDNSVSPGKISIYSASTLNDGLWHYAVMVRDGNLLHFYIDGSEVPTSPVDITGYGSINSVEPFLIAACDNYDNAGAPNLFASAKIDEVHVLSSTTSSEWILTEFNNQDDPSGFYSMGVEQEVIVPQEVPLDFKFKKDITIDHNNVDSDLYGFPVLIDLYDTDLRFDVQSDGDDILFAKDGWILPHEIELFKQSYNSTHGHLVAWVRTDLSASIDTIITMYYGNPNTENQEDPAVVWGGSSVGTWHLGESGTGAADEYWDSSPYYNHGQGGEGIADDVPIIIDGKIGYGQDFDGSDDLISIGNSHSLQPSEITWSAWVKRTSSWTSKRMALLYAKTTWNGPGWYVQIDDVSTGGPSIPRDLLMVVDGSNFFTYNGVPLDTLYPLNEWVHLAATFDSTTNAMELYVNGVAQPLQIFGVPDSITSTSATKYIPDNSGNYVGSMDEVHVVSKVRSPDWILTEYRNQNDPFSFYTIGEENIVGRQQELESEFSHKKDIVIDHMKVDADLVDFPMLIDIYDTDLRNDVQTDGDDIIFKDGNMVLPHEIELFNQTYNSTHAHLAAWIKVDVSSSTDTTISMYYGNPYIENQEKPSDVWNSNYVAVWHMNQDPSSSTILDSTINGYDLTAAGFASDQRIFDGKVGTAISVDGINDRFGINGISGPVNDFTFQSWFSLDNPFPSGSDMHFFRGNSLTNDYPLMRFATSSGLIVTHMEVTSDNDETCTGSKSSWEADTWFQFAWVRNMAAVRAYHYLNGSL
ncbi:MAG: LamG-like jellyroll fold domain-containing protein, partial [Candidatus Thorarchaeota archaeon]